MGIKTVDLNLAKDGSSIDLRGSFYKKFKGYKKVKTCKHIDLELYNPPKNEIYTCGEYSEEITVTCKICKIRYEAMIEIN